MYNPDGTWFKEGYGVDPDIPVDRRHGRPEQGVDTQLERAITEIKNALKNKPYLFKQPKRRESEVFNAVDQGMVCERFRH